MMGQVVKIGHLTMSWNFEIFLNAYLIKCFILIKLKQ